MKQSAANKQAHWMAQFSDAVTAIDARHAGRINWSHAKHLYFEGVSPADAAKRYTDAA